MAMDVVDFGRIRRRPMWRASFKRAIQRFVISSQGQQECQRAYGRRWSCGAPIPPSAERNPRPRLDVWRRPVPRIASARTRQLSSWVGSILGSSLQQADFMASVHCPTVIQQLPSNSQELSRPSYVDPQSRLCAAMCRKPLAKRLRHIPLDHRLRVDRALTIRSSAHGLRVAQIRRVV